MQIVRMIVWVLLLSALLVFSFANWNPPVDVTIWPNLVVQTKIPAIVVISVLIGVLPTWLVYLATKWQHKRRMGTLAANHRAALQAAASAEPEPVIEPAEHPVPPPVP